MTAVWNKGTDKLPHDSHSLGEWVTHREPVNQLPGVGAPPHLNSNSGWTGDLTQKGVGARLYWEG